MSENVKIFQLDFDLFACLLYKHIKRDNACDFSYLTCFNLKTLNYALE